MTAFPDEHDDRLVDLLTDLLAALGDDARLVHWRPTVNVPTGEYL